MATKPNTTKPSSIKAPKPKKLDAKALEPAEPIMIIKLYSGHSEVSIKKDVAQLSLIKIIIYAIPLSIREIIFKLTGKSTGGDMLEKTLTRVASKTLRTGRPY